MRINHKRVPSVGHTWNVKFKWICHHEIEFVDSSNQNGMRHKSEQMRKDSPYLMLVHAGCSYEQRNDPSSLPSTLAKFGNESSTASRTSTQQPLASSIYGTYPPRCSAPSNGISKKMTASGAGSPTSGLLHQSKDIMDSQLPTLSSS